MGWGTRFLALTTLSVLTGCGGKKDVGRSRLGESCVLQIETQALSSGQAHAEVNIERDSSNCGGGICLSNHFQGRVTCPYGQSEEEIETLPPDDPARCRLPGALGSSEDEAVSVPVRPQLLERRAEDTVICSCRCNGPDPDAEYCTCPTGMECVELVRPLGLGSDDVAGSYCIVEGTAHDDSPDTEATCRKGEAFGPASCGNDGHNP